jgi:hypothetical protein
MKNPLTPVGVEPATFRFVARHLNHCATATGIEPAAFRFVARHLNHCATAVPHYKNVGAFNSDL